MIHKSEGIKVIRNLIEIGSEQSMLELIHYARNHQLKSNEIAELAKGLAFSGYLLKAVKGCEYYDIPSTGGPSSLSTLVSPLVLSSMGKCVMKLGVPGRPAGGIDVLTQIEGYQIAPSKDELEKWQSSGNFIHILANSIFAPLDIAFFEFRKKFEAINIPSLVIASILAKKVAFAVNNVGLDLRVSDFGNFGSTWNEARANAQLFNQVASQLGIRSKCFISNGFSPQQPYIGRGESLLALRRVFIEENANKVLVKHLSHCISMAFSLAGKTAYVKIAGSILEREFKKNLSLQGGSYDSFVSISEQIERGHEHELIAPRSGFIKINLEKIRESILTIQNQVISSNYSDPCGVILYVDSYNYVTEGTVICTYRCESLFLGSFRELLELSFTFVEEINRTNELEIL